MDGSTVERKRKNLHRRERSKKNEKMSLRIAPRDGPMTVGLCCGGVAMVGGGGGGTWLVPPYKEKEKKREREKKEREKE